MTVRKVLNESEQALVGMIVEGFMDRFQELLPVMALHPEKGAHIFNAGIASFVYTAARRLDEAHAHVKDMKDYTPLNMHGKQFTTHLEFFIYMLQNGAKKEFKAKD